VSHRKNAAQKPKEPLILWWMPVVALIAPLLAVIWQAATADNNVAGAAAFALIWPGLPLYLVTLAVLWGGWKIELE
jgi:hypothetical protein